MKILKFCLNFNFSSQMMAKVSSGMQSLSQKIKLKSAAMVICLFVKKCKSSKSRAERNRLIDVLKTNGVSDLNLLGRGVVSEFEGSCKAATAVKNCDFEHASSLEVQSAVVIQTSMRRHLAGKIASKLQQESRSAIRIQGLFQRNRARNQETKLKLMNIQEVYGSIRESRNGELAANQKIIVQRVSSHASIDDSSNTNSGKASNDSPPSNSKAETAVTLEDSEKTKTVSRFAEFATKVPSGAMGSLALPISTIGNAHQVSKLSAFIAAFKS